MGIVKRKRGAYKRKPKPIKTMLTAVSIYYLCIDSKYEEIVEFILVELLNLRNKQYLFIS